MDGIPQDTIRVRNISVLASFTDGAQWPSSPPKPKLQPIQVTLSINHSIASTALMDDLDHSINYSTVCKTAIAVAQSRDFSCSEDCVNNIIDACFQEHGEIHTMSVTLTRPKALLQPASVLFSSTRRRGITESIEELAIHGLECYPIVGVNECEREQTQLVRFDISMQRRTNGYDAELVFPFRELALKLVNVCAAHLDCR